MAMHFDQRGIRAADKIVGVVLLLMLVLGLSLASSSAQVHALLCPEAGQAGDFCAIKQFQSGFLEASPAQVVLITPPLSVTTSSHESRLLHLVSPHSRLSAARAPPLA